MEDIPVEQLIPSATAVNILRACIVPKNTWRGQQ